MKNGPLLNIIIFWKFQIGLNSSNNRSDTIKQIRHYFLRSFCFNVWHYVLQHFCLAGVFCSGVRLLKQKWELWLWVYKFQRDNRELNVFTSKRLSKSRCSSQSQHRQSRNLMLWFLKASESSKSAFVLKACHF